MGAALSAALMLAAASSCSGSAAHNHSFIGSLRYELLLGCPLLLDCDVVVHSVAAKLRSSARPGAAVKIVLRICICDSR